MISVLRVSALLFIFIAVLLSQSLCAGKKKAGDLSISLAQVDGCDAIFLTTQEPSPFLKNVEEVKVNGAVRFRQGSALLEKFPDDITLHVTYRSDPGGIFRGQRPPCKKFDPGAVRIKSIWKSNSGTTIANGNMSPERLPPEPFCETTCAESWVYTLTIESRDVPLTDDLVLTIDAGDGAHIATLRGGLGPLTMAITPAPVP